MPTEERFTDVEPLSYYYKHGYKLMNPFCRILSESPQYRYILEWRNLQYEGEKDSRQVVADSVTIKALMTLKRSLDSKSWDLLNLDESSVNSVLTGDAGAEHRLMVSTYREMGVTTDMPSEGDVLKYARKTSRDRLGALWHLLVETRRALAAASPPACSWLIRGDTDGMIGYLATQGATFPPATPLAASCQFDRTWQTNQFFSTSDGDELASLAGRALIWLIRINPGATQGRVGGLYTSEAEILFPYDVTLRLNGGVLVSSVEQIDNVNLASFDKPEELRKKLRQVYKANQSSLTNGKARFLVATEE
ncbi:hypothetical protein LQ564_12525 [Massilia sp. G4R7]|uniref:Uncharacterized protein n=1 Tax=Massilia phyllostachyos TaxID=2898585 RepID=A0ABS8Q5W7_9BURK|nr:hypothetical protein [Massilia phyllostachyos]MCD2517131.1 hypothetical protein [Massilia phyllostachyos]